jgi:monooxygenase
MSGGLAPLIDLASGYVQRGIDVFPKQATVEPWRQQQNYIRDLRLLTRGPLDDHVVFASASATHRRSRRAPELPVRRGQGPYT